MAARLLNKIIPANIDSMDWKETIKASGGRQHLITQYELRATLFATSHGNSEHAACVISNFLKNKTNTRVSEALLEITTVKSAKTDKTKGSIIDGIQKRIKLHTNGGDSRTTVD